MINTIKVLMQGLFTQDALLLILAGFVGSLVGMYIGSFLILSKNILSLSIAGYVGATVGIVAYLYFNKQ